jgi:hypothetical protein
MISSQSNSFLNKVSCNLLEISQVVRLLKNENTAPFQTAKRKPAQNRVRKNRMAELLARWSHPEFFGISTFQQMWVPHPFHVLCEKDGAPTNPDRAN